MDLIQWRSEVKQQAGRLRERLRSLVRQTEQLAPGVIYGATAGLAVLPLVAAAQSGTVPYGELARILGSMGANLLSNELNAWKQRSEAQLSEELPAHLSELAVANPGWRDVLDKLIEVTQVDSAVQTALGEAGVPYMAALQEDAQRLGSRIFVANVGDNAGNVLIGDGSTQTVTETHYHGSISSIILANVSGTTEYNIGNNIINNHNDSYRSSDGDRESIDGRGKAEQTGKVRRHTEIQFPRICYINKPVELTIRLTIIPNFVDDEDFQDPVSIDLHPNTTEKQQKYLRLIVTAASSGFSVSPRWQILHMPLEGLKPESC